MIYCPNSTCAKPRNQESSSFCSHCGTPLKIGDRFHLTEPLDETGQSFLAVDQHLPSRPRCCIVYRGELAVEQGWSQEQLARLEYLSNQGHLPQLIALVDCPTPNGSSAPTNKLLAYRWLGGTSLAQRMEQDGAISEFTLRQHLNAVLADLVQIHDQGFIHGDIRPSTLVQRSADQRFLAASYREIAPICEATKPAQGQTQDLQILQYWAPERKLGQPVPASDLYSLGVSAIQLLTAQPLEQLFDVAEDCWCWEDSLETELSDGLRAMLNCLLERATRRRYGSAVDVLRDLAHLDDLAELADLAEPIAPLPQSSGLDAVHQRSSEAKPSDDTTADLKESEIETLPLKKKTAERSQSQGSFPIGNALDDAAPDKQGIQALEQTVTDDRFSPATPSADTTASAPAAPKPANLSPADSLKTPTIPPPDSDARQVKQDIEARVAKLLVNPLAISIGGLVRQLAQQQASQGAKTYLPWEIMRSLKQLQRSPETNLTFATQLLEMANFYREQVHAGQRDLRHFTITIVAYEQALTGLNREHQLFPNVCHDLGRMYMNLSRQHPSYRLDCLKKAVATFQRGLVQADVNNDAYLELQNQLGEAYGTLATSEAPAEHWQGAIAAYQAALTACPAEAPSGEQEIERNEPHGAIQNNLGTALWNLSLHSSNGKALANLQAAIAAYNAALAHHDPDADPIRFGMIQNNLGTAYLNLAQSEKSIDLLRLATGTFQVALMYRQRNEVPLAHAATQNNLGAASLQLAGHRYADPQTQRESLEQSIAAYEAALGLVKQLSAIGATSIGFDPSASRLNLGLAHQRRGCLSDSSDNSSVVFAHLETAMQIYLDLLDKQAQGSDIYEMALEYIGQTMHHLSEHLHLADDHPLLTQVPNQIVAEMSQQFQRQLQRVS